MKKTILFNFQLSIIKKLLIAFIFCFLSSIGFAQYKTEEPDGSSFLNFNSLDNSITCDSLNKLISIHGSIEKITDPNLKLLAIMTQIQCSVSMLNNISTTIGDTAHLYQAQVLMDQDAVGNPRVLFNLIDLKSLTTAKDYATVIANFAPVLVAGSTGPVGEFLMKSGIATAMGKYSIEAYFESAVKNDPLIILYPTIIPAKKFSEDVMKELSRNRVFNEVSKLWEDPAGTIINPIGKLATSGTKEVVKGVENISKETGKAAENVAKAVKKATRITIKW